MRKIALAGAGIACAAAAFAPEMPRATADQPVCYPASGGGSSCAFYSPSHDISCELDYGQLISGTTTPAHPVAYCQSGPTPQNVHMDASGALTICTNSPGATVYTDPNSCLGNPGLGQQALPYGQSVALGPFSCLSQTSGMTCTTPSGHGFTISRAAITPV